MPVANGRKTDVLAVTLEFAPEGLDAALVTAGGEAADRALSAVRERGRVAYPSGVQPEPQSRAGVTLSSYNGAPDPEILRSFNDLIASGPFEVHVARTLPLDQVSEAHHALADHYLGKLALRVP